jgi:hypothetical protein
MFKRFFPALSDLTANVTALAASIREANDNFRANLGMDNHEEPVDQPAQLEHHEEAEATRTP